MPVTIPTKFDKLGRMIEVQSTPIRAHEPTFDSYLVLHENGTDNHTLTLVLRLYLDQIAPLSWNLPYVGTVTLPFVDWNKTPFVIKPWTAADFAAFTAEFKKQCAHWTNKFWLTPPAGFTGYDYRRNGRTVRPNVYCHLYVDLVGSAATAHQTIRLVNLDTAAAAAKLGKAERDLNASDFRSDSATYDSLDTRPVPLPFPDHTGTVHRLNRSTIAHEVGHALGLPHAGVPHKAPLCELAMVMDRVLPKSATTAASYPALYKGGSNSNACYGHTGPPNVGSNVMGYGLEFDATNAQPWLDRIALHTGTKAADWGVSVKRNVPPKHL